MSDLTIGDRTVKVNELTVTQVRAWLNQPAPKGDEVDVVAEMLFDDCNFATIVRMTNLTLAELDEMVPSEIRAVVRKCQEVNAHFFGMARRTGQLASQLSSQLATLDAAKTPGISDDSSETAPPS